MIEIKNYILIFNINEFLTIIILVYFINYILYILLFNTNH